MTHESDPGPVLYASISRGPTVLADFFSTGIAPDEGGGDGGGGDITSLAGICLAAAPRFHLLYTHTTCRRMYAFLMADPVLLFAIADDSLGRTAVLLFLHRLRDATILSAQRRVGAGEPLFHRCLQDELRPVICRLAVSFSTRPTSEAEKPSPLPLLPSPLLSSTPPSSDSHLLTCEHKRKSKKDRKKNARSEEGFGASHGDELEISVLDNDIETEIGLGLGGRKTLQRIWRQQVRMVLMIDVVVCTLLFGIWLSICKGFQCIGG